MTNLIIGLIIALLFSAFFSGMEIAFVSSNRMLAEMDREKNGLSQRCIAYFYSKPNTFVSTMLVGNNIALVIYGILFAKLFDQILFYDLHDGARVTADTLLSTLVVLFMGEFIPKNLFKSRPNTMLTVFAVPAMVIYIILYPISRFTSTVSRGCLRMFGANIDESDDDKSFTKVDLDYLVEASINNAEEGNGSIDEEVRIFRNALDFTDKKVRDCMVPRTEIECIEIDSSVGELKRLFIESGYSKIIVYKEDIDHIVGYIHSSEMFRLKDDNVKLSQLDNRQIRTILFVPETMAANKLMHQLLQQKKTLGVVVDEFGGTSGIVSLEDIVEEIFGDIEDEHDNTNYVAKRTDDGDYILSARLEIEKVNEMFDLDLPESDEYKTVSGLILHEYQSLPKLNEIVEIGKFKFKIIKNTMTKIEIVRLKVTE